jgi:rhombotail lipoprotein
MPAVAAAKSPQPENPRRSSRVHRSTRGRPDAPEAPAKEGQMRRSVAVCVLFLGCSHGFDRGQLKERLDTEAVQVTDADVRAALSLKPQLRFPIKVGVAFLEEDTFDRSDPRAARWHWSERDREAVLAATATLRERGVISDLFVIAKDLIAGRDLKHLRLAAAKHGADAVIVVQGAAQVDRYVNALAILNLSILGGFVVPASHRDAVFAVRCAMWDVGNEVLYLTAETEGEAKRLGPTFLIEDGPALDGAKEDALRGFDAELTRRLTALKGS